LKAIVRKEFYHLIRDYRSLYLAFAIPLLLIILFGYALSLDVDHIKTIVVDYDKTPLSRDFADKLIREGKAKEFLVEHGFVKQTGGLTKRYGG
jgi:hypothetical protein